MKPFAEEVREIICIYYAITGGGYYTALERDVNAICEAVRRRIPKMKECLPVESAEQITHDKMEEYETYKYGYNQCLTDLRARLEK